MDRRKRLVLVVGARPNFMKAAPILDAFKEFPQIEMTLVHTGQHYDPNLSDVFFNELQIRKPDVMLSVGSGSHAQQTAQIMIRFEEFLNAESQANRPVDGVIVVGDVNSTAACALVASKLLVPVIHVEAGLRSFDRTMPEEINRIVTDSLSDLLLCSEPKGVENLKREGQPHDAIHLVGNVMIDTLRKFESAALKRDMLKKLDLLPGGYAVVTLHRPANVDAPEVLSELLTRLEEISASIPLVFSVHPRTAARIEASGIKLANNRNFQILPPLGYLDFLCLTSQARLILTDSGGLQEEATALGVPCLTLRPNTERPITVDQGSSRLVGNDWDLMEHLVESILEGQFAASVCPAIWDGKAGVRIANLLAEWLGVEQTVPVTQLASA